MKCSAAHVQVKTQAQELGRVRDVRRERVRVQRMLDSQASACLVLKRVAFASIVWPPPPNSWVGEVSSLHANACPRFPAASLAEICLAMQSWPS